MVKAVPPLRAERVRMTKRAAIAAAAALAFGAAAVAAPQDPQPNAGGRSAQAKALHAPAGNGKGEKARQNKPVKPDGAKTEPGKTETGKTEAPNPQAPSEPPPPPYEPQILRLAEILGALAYLDDLCGSTSAWRARMQQFLEAEAKTVDRKERLAGSFNRSFHDYEQSYQTCTPSAQLIISRFLSEGGRLARDVVNRFSAS